MDAASAWSVAIPARACDSTQSAVAARTDSCWHLWRASCLRPGALLSQRGLGTAGVERDPVQRRPLRPPREGQAGRAGGEQELRVQVPAPAQVRPRCSLNLQRVHRWPIPGPAAVLAAATGSCMPRFAVARQHAPCICWGRGPRRPDLPAARRCERPDTPNAPGPALPWVPQAARPAHLRVPRGHVQPGAQGGC